MHRLPLFLTLLMPSVAVAEFLTVTPEITHDTRTGLDWLAWDLTTDCTSDMVAERYPEWRLATDDELRGLLVSADLVNETQFDRDHPGVRFLLARLGPTYTAVTPATRFERRYVDRSAFAVGVSSSIKLSIVDTDLNWSEAEVVSTELFPPNEWFGRALVMDHTSPASPVPEPSTLLLIAVAAGLVWRRRTAIGQSDA